MDPVFLYAISRRSAKLKKARKVWVHPLLANREFIGEHLKIEDMFKNYPDRFKVHMRMTTSQFVKLEKLLTPMIEKKDTNYRSAIPVRTRIMITLRFLATGDSLQSIATSFCVGKTTVRDVINATCEAIWLALSKDYVKAPSTHQDWLKVSKEFNSKWQLPNCAGAIDGKHITVIAPNNTGSQYFNYKGYFSIVLMATCDADYNFTTVDVGAYGKQSDGGVFSNSGLGARMDEGYQNSYKTSETLSISGIECYQKLPNTNLTLPLYLVGDEAFPLKSHLLRPFPAKELDTRKRIFNYRLSRGRRIIENCFGIMSARFRVLRRAIHASVKKACAIVKACVALHNFIRMEDDDKENRSEVDRAPSGLHGLSNAEENQFTGKDVRDKLADYFMHEGQVSWQMDSVFNISQ